MLEPHYPTVVVRKGSLSQPVTPRRRIETMSSSLDEDAEFWCNSTGSVLEAMMQKANYDINLQRAYLSFFCRYVASSLGKRPSAEGKPRNWYSFMADDFTPIELSWSWAGSRPLPKVRYSIEPIGPYAGTLLDPFNGQMTISLINKIWPKPLNLDLRSFNRLYSDLLAFEPKGTNTNALCPASEPRSQTFMAFDLNDSGAMLKAYFIPNLKAIETGQSKIKLVRESLKKLDCQHLPMFGAVELLSKFIDSRPANQPLELEIVGIDCVSLATSRIKIYVRSRLTSFESVVDIMTLGGTLKDPGTEAGLAEVKELWRLVLSLDPEFSISEPLHTMNHRTAGVLYYFEFLPQQRLPQPKVYIPVKHYGKNDFEIANGLSAWLVQRKKALYGSSYVQALKEIL